MGRPRAETVTTATPERVLDAAEAVFAGVGFAQATLAEIAARAGIRRPSLLYHFRSKEELYAASVERTFADLRRVLLAAMREAGDFEHRLTLTVRHYRAFLDTHPNAARIVLRELLAGDGPGALLVLRQVVPLLDMVEAFVREVGAGVVRSSLPIRAAILTMAADLLMRSAADPALRTPLWGDDDHSETIARLLFFASGDEPTQRTSDGR